MVKLGEFVYTRPNLFLELLLQTINKANNFLEYPLITDPGGRGTPYNGLYREAPPEKGTIFGLQVYARVGILIVEVHERVGKSVIWVCGKGPKGRTDEFYGFIESGKRSIFVIDSYLKDSTFTAV